MEEIEKRNRDDKLGNLLAFDGLTIQEIQNQKRIREKTEEYHRSEIQEEEKEKQKNRKGRINVYPTRTSQ